MLRIAQKGAHAFYDGFGKNERIYFMRWAVWWAITVMVLQASWRPGDRTTARLHFEYFAPNFIRSASQGGVASDLVCQFVGLLSPSYG